MVNFQHKALQLDYDPTNGVLEVSFPNLREYSLSEIKEAIDYMVSQIIKYEIKHLLIDSRFTVLQDQPQRLEAGLYFASQIASTPIRKMAKIKSLDIKMEEIAEQNYKIALEEGLITWIYKGFDDRANALRWLTNMVSGIVISAEPLLMLA